MPPVAFGISTLRTAFTEYFSVSNASRSSFRCLPNHSRSWSTSISSIPLLPSFSFTCLNALFRFPSSTIFSNRCSVKVRYLSNREDNSTPEPSPLLITSVSEPAGSRFRMLNKVNCSPSEFFCCLLSLRIFKSFLLLVNFSLRYFCEAFQLSGVGSSLYLLCLLLTPLRIYSFRFRLAYPFAWTP